MKEPEFFKRTTFMQESDTFEPPDEQEENALVEKLQAEQKDNLLDIC